MTALTESFLSMSIHNVFSWPISTFLRFSRIGKPVLDIHIQHPRGTPGSHLEDLWGSRLQKDGMYPVTCAKMMAGMTVGEYMANFEMLAGRTSFYEAALEDEFVQGLPKSILQKVYSQNLAPIWYGQWKMVVHNLECLQRGFTELKQSVHLS